jgi:hypothetical protein
LSLLVFAWGLGYKLSLYDPPQAVSHKIPQAKLLSKNEKTVAALSPLLSDTEASRAQIQAVLCSVLLLFIAAYRLSNPKPVVPLEFDVMSLRRSRLCFGLTFFFVLPPPILA